jgi:hypothetical protein
MIREYVTEHLPVVVEDVNKRFKTLKSALDYDSLSTKLKSELISSILETAFASVVPNVISPKLDREPDLRVFGEPLEIKTSKTTYVWRGGEFSKRESDYLLVSYDDSEDTLKWFMIHTHLLESDWKSSVSDSYYATTIDLNYVLENKDHQILIGSLLKKKTKSHLVCE